jgi:hypothetical protein
VLPDFGHPVLKHAEVRASVAGLVYVARVVVLGVAVVVVGVEDVGKVLATVFGVVAGVVLGFITVVYTDAVGARVVVLRSLVLESLVFEVSVVATTMLSSALK